jgi:rubrerythrin
MPVKPTEAGASDADYVPFVLAGEHVKGEFHCSECGYGVTIYRVLPRCPMCGGESWEQKDWSPFARARNVLQ